jgi:hypothetical protein
VTGSGHVGRLILLELTEALELLRTIGDGPVTESHRNAGEAVGREVVASVKDGTRHEVAGSSYRVEEVTWPVSRHGDQSNAYACPRPVVSLVRGDAVLLDVRSDYWDGHATYEVVGAKLGRWRRFRIGSPGEAGYDLHLPTDEEFKAFAAEAADVVATFGVLGAGAATPAE